MFQNLVDILNKIDPAKLNGVLSAVAEGLRGQGDRIGQSITDTNEVLLALNPRADTFRENWHALAAVSDTYGAAAQQIIDTLAGATVTSATVISQSAQLDALLANVTGLSRSGIDVLGPSKDNLVKSVNSLQPTTGC